MKKLGLKLNLIEAWRQFHTITSATDYQTGIQAKFLYQRKTGDSFTCLGNTLVSMSALAACFDMQHLKCAALVGDDSLIFFDKLPYGQDGERDLRLMFNLESKVIIEGAPYFCSSFLLSNGSKYALVPDSLKRLERLGKLIYSIDEVSLVVTRIKAPHCHVSGGLHGIDSNPTKDILLLYGLCYLAAGQITSSEGDSPCDDLIWGLFNPLIYSIDEYASLHERWVSFGDQLQVLHDYAFYNSLCYAISSKYVINVNTEIILVCLYSLIKSEKSSNSFLRLLNKWESFYPLPGCSVFSSQLQVLNL